MLHVSAAATKKSQPVPIQNVEGVERDTSAQLAIGHERRAPNNILILQTVAPQTATWAVKHRGSISPYVQRAVWVCVGYLLFDIWGISCAIWLIKAAMVRGYSSTANWPVLLLS